MAFDLGAALKNVSRVDTGKEQITYLPIGSLDSDPKNFYELRGIEELADNISVAGLQQPIRVRAGEAPGRYIIVSGHRRLAAVKALAQEAPEKWTDVPCIIETDDASPALQQLRLIYANANTRQLSSAEISDQAKQVEMLLYQLQEEGYSFPGRMRDHVAEAVGVSRSKLARLKVIRDNLIPEFEESWRAGKISEGTAYRLAQASRERQKLIFEAQGRDSGGKLTWLSEGTVKSCLDEMDKARAICGALDCFRGCKCDHAAAREQRAAKLQSYSALNCRGCCRDCSNLAACKGSCELAGDLKKELRSKITAENAAKKAAEKAAEKDRAAAAKALLAKSYGRVRTLREDRNIPRTVFLKASTGYMFARDSERLEKLEQGQAMGNDRMPGGIWADEAQRLVATADLLGCSVDYLLGRDVPETAGTWHSGTPEAAGTYVAAYNFPDDDGTVKVEKMRWSDYGWILYDMPLPEGFTVHFWTEVPDVKIKD